MHVLITLIALLSLNSIAKSNKPIPQMVDVDCMNCHRDQELTFVPMIDGQNEEFLEFELLNFRDYVRDHEIMNQIMEDFTDKEVKEIAAYISNLSLCDAQAKVLPLPGANIKNGEKIFNNSCFECHKKDTSGYGPVIHGQKSEYLANAIKSFQSTWYEPRPSRSDMRGHTDKLNEQDIKDVTSYLNQQKLCE